MQQALDILKKYWQHNTFRTPQEAVINTVLSGKDAFALMPTGGGKSVCFQVPALMQPGICVVISPLIALMRDQVQNLEKKGIKAISLAGSLSVDELSNLLDNCLHGNYKFVYLSPERLQAEWVAVRIKQLPVSLVAVDEAHCVSQWGHDFRPAYLKIADFKKMLPDVPFLALTASATQKVQQDIITHLGLKDPAVFKKSFYRENIAYMVFETEDKLYRIRQILTKHPEPSIIYVRNRRACHDMASQLTAMGYTATYYHGGLKEYEKEANMQLWLKDRAQIMVATNAFGMGIDKPNVKTVIHIQLPENIESYYQEAGRAGRNGKKAYAVLLVNKSDVQNARNQFINVLPDKDFLKKVYNKINAYLKIAYGEGTGKTYAFDFNEFCTRYGFNPVKTYNTLLFLDRQGVLTLTREFYQKVKMQFIISGREVLRYISLNPSDEPALLVLMRSYPGLFDMETAVNTVMIAKKAGIAEGALLGLLQKLQKKEIISLQLSGTDSSLIFNEVREDVHTLSRVSKYLLRQNENKVNHLEAVIRYAFDESHCKSRIILEYFDEQTDTDCGICSYCITKKANVVPADVVANAILSTLRTAPLGSRQLQEQLGFTSKDTLFALQLLLENEKISITPNNEYIII
ncbi:RecQ family ATP-dependent DNA helicase [Flavobacterium rhizosphaerae]|uniref:ATP-dependent DNA helicase RecQ n=1 Tax=Flavobacterium rhizosphaerae TaxID=3163298 RepID=A0ABW8Z025_9FLAO